jgi:endonuclease/exonuclease/phosphatase family metal-dependent hydrolase
MVIIVLLFSGIAVTYHVFRSVNEFRPRGIFPLEVSRLGGNTPARNETISILTWNIGYAGLGAEADFRADGGRSVFPKSRRAVESNLAGICSFLESCPAQIVLLQEVARDSRLTRFVNVHEELTRTLDSHDSVFSPTISIRRLPFLGNLVVGNAIYSKTRLGSASRVCLPLARGRILGLIKQHFNGLEVRLPFRGNRIEWVILNIHLAAFDVRGSVRRTQLEFLRSYMISEYNNGNFVVVGGDWNCRLDETSFPHSTKEAFLFWLIDLPEDFTPPGWSWGFDDRYATVRTLQKPFVEGENYTTIIDGFVISPNAVIEDIEGFDLRFAHSDHQPVWIRLHPRSR